MSITVKPTATKAVKTAEEERWRNSSLYPEIMVSSRGRVKEREYQRVVKDPQDGCFRIYAVPAKMIEPKVAPSGEVTVSFYSGTVWTSKAVAILVATEFVTNEDPDHYNKVKFKDGNRANLNASNLYWDGSGIYSR